MKAQVRLDLETGVAAVTLTALVATLSYLMLSVLAAPKDLSTRLAAVEETLSAQPTTRASVAAASYPAGAVCDAPLDPARAALKRRLQTAADQTGVTVATLSVAPQPADPAVRDLLPLAFEVEANGREDAITTMLRILSDASPALFVDGLDLSSGVSTVTLKLSGHIFCSTSVRP